jgi:EAL domain-containing protein (putative c-di-GMP-specific phosphodiesterase class I)
MSSLLKTGIEPNRLEIEVTESVFLMQDEKLLGDLHKLHEIGVSLALDDFGTGYASLGYLQKLPFSKIKLDKSFVSDIETNRQSSEIAVAIASLCSNLGLKTTAEGIETELQRELIRAAGYTFGQGYLFAKPMPNHAFIASETEAQELEHKVAIQ